MSGIGTLNEKPLHASLKEWYAEPGDQFEVAVDGFQIDIVRDDLLLEIQTRGFASIKRKMATLVRSHPVRLIYPVAEEKWIVKMPVDEHDEVTRRKSPKRGRMEDMFREMVSFPKLLTNSNFSLEVLLTREEEQRRYEENRHWRRRGWATEERRLLEVVGRRVFENPADWGALIPEELEQFTTRDLAEAKGMRVSLAQKMAYCLRNVGVIQLTGKRGRANLYRIL